MDYGVISLGFAVALTVWPHLSQGASSLADCNVKAAPVVLARASRPCHTERQRTASAGPALQDICEQQSIGDSMQPTRHVKLVTGD